MKQGLVQFTIEEISLAIMALEDLRQHFKDEWPDDVKSAALKACAVVERLGPVSTVRGFEVIFG